LKRYLLRSNFELTLIPYIISVNSFPWFSALKFGRKPVNDVGCRRS
jgi:hypothetical protein